ncbi:Mut7-C RNAse domain-containing protein [Ferrimonas marina]|uniref:Mut7-C RNAse domain-containing protein n=1 Tax=Ferrimonas marina TaxID=299255 RepID=A0A1M5Z9K6_9GAMM|nr:Mut7-C RNAse domain-containing protein [Ferrimonas marina]SHI20899.1 Mut7-C RNAse domain-containing protein [Ferrimonas marina]
MNPPPRFLADAMLIRLARWLRALGYDTACYPSWPDSALVALANREGRWLLTRDRALVRELRPDRVIAIESQRPLAQLTQVLEALTLPPPQLRFDRCLLCNGPLTDWLVGRPPPQYASHCAIARLRHCADCQRLLARSPRQAHERGTQASPAANKLLNPRSSSPQTAAMTSAYAAPVLT